jgi:iron complex outermembrane receptor protein
LAGATGIPVVSFDPDRDAGHHLRLNRWVDATVLSRNWTVDEKVTTAYAMGDVDGTLGLAAVHGQCRPADREYETARHWQPGGPGQMHRHHRRHLPVWCAGRHQLHQCAAKPEPAFDLGKEQYLRFGAGKQISRANLDNMKASMDFGLQSATSTSPALTGFAGNPQLKPYSGDRLTSRTRSTSASGLRELAGFYKKLDNYVINAPREFDFGPTPAPPRRCRQPARYKGRRSAS